jgi:hypothetical protein
MRWTPTYSTVQHGIKIIIPEHSAELLWSDYENNVWNIKSRTGCDMTLYRPTDFAAQAEDRSEVGVKGDGESRSERTKWDPYLMLTGQPTAVSAAVYDILKITKDVTIIGLEGGTPTVLHDGREAPPPVASSATPVPSAVTETPIRHYPRSAPCRPYTLNIRADQIPRPAEWTIESFQHYIAALTMGRMHESLAAKLYPGADTHQRIVVKQLHDVFNDPAASAAVSNPAFKLALQYLVRSGETFVGDARALFGSVGTLGLRMDTEVFNLMAETAVMSKNLLAFEGTVRRMAACGHAPNLRTWLLFLRLVEAEDVRRYILHAMDTKNFFSNPSAVASVSVEMADHDVHRAVQLGQDFDGFIAGLRALYGPQWRLHTRAANRYLDVFGRYSKFDESRQLLELMFASEHCRPNVISLNTVLTHCKQQNKVDLAICFVRMFDQQGLNVADKITFHLLFEVARKTRKTYLLSAVWRYAHVLGMTKHSMRDRGMRLLAGGEQEVKHMTYWIRALWEGPDGCKIAKQELLETLLLCDWRSRGGETQLLGEPRANAKQQSVGDGPAHKASRESSLSQGNQPQPAGHTSGDSSEHSPEHKYYLFSNFMTKLAQNYVPVIPLGDFLQAALDHDRKLRRLLLDGERVADSMVLHTVELPLTKVTDRRYKENHVLRWLAKRQGKKEDVAPRETVSREVAESRKEEVAAGKETEVMQHTAHVKREENVLEELLIRKVAEPVQDVAEPVQEEVTMHNETEPPLHAIPAERVDGLPKETAGQEVAEPMQAEEVLDNLDAGWETEETQHTTQVERKDNVLEETVIQEVAESIPEDVATSNESKETLGAVLAQMEDSVPEKVVSELVSEPIQGEVDTNNQANETPGAVLARREDPVPQEALSQETAEPMQAEEDVNISDVTGVTDDTPSAQTEPLTMGQAETWNAELEGIMNMEAAETTEEAEALGKLPDGEETKGLSRAVQPEPVMMAKADTREGVLEEVMSEEGREPTQKGEDLRPLGGEGEFDEAPNCIQPEPVTIGQANEGAADSVATTVQVQTVGTAAGEEVGDLVKKVAQVQSAQRQSSEENTTQPPLRRSRNIPRRINEDQPSRSDKRVDASRSAQAQARRPQAGKESSDLESRAIKVPLDGASRHKGKNKAGRPDKRLYSGSRTQRLRRMSVSNGDSETQTLQPKLGKALPQKHENQRSPLDLPDPKPTAHQDSPLATAEESRDDEEDLEAMERAHSVLRYLLKAAEQFGPAKPEAQTGMLGKPRAGMGMGVQYPALPADRWGYAADGRKETMASGYLMGPSTDFEGSRMQTPTGPGGS